MYNLCLIFRELIEEIAKFEEHEFSAKQSVSQVISLHCIIDDKIGFF